MKTIVITGGEAPTRAVARVWLDRADLIIAADSGLETARSYGVRPAIIVGDFDSISDESILMEYDRERVRRYPSAKDETDTEIALDAARDEGATAVVLIGGGGGRLDHALAIVALFERETHPDVWVTHDSLIAAIDHEAVIHGRIGERISFFPLGCEECSMTSRGLRWPLDGLAWRRGDVGISNELSQAEAVITMHRGRLLMVRENGRT